MLESICGAECGQCPSKDYGLVADEDHLLVCEYGEGSSGAEIILYKKRT